MMPQYVLSATQQSGQFLLADFAVSPLLQHLLYWRYVIFKHYHSHLSSREPARSLRSLRALRDLAHGFNHLI
jgi:hypothetical protein